MDHSLEAHLLSQTDNAAGFFWHRIRWRYVAGHLPRGPFTLLDVGAGSGVTGEFLARDRPDATYVFDEPIDSLRARLRDRYGAPCDLHDAESLPDIDVVTLLDVLEHVEDDRTFLGDLVRRLAPGTKIIVTVPASMRLWSEWDVLLGHFRRYEPDSLTALFASVPIRVDETGRLFPELVPAAWWRARRRPAASGPSAPSIDPGVAEFPDLPAPVDRLLELVSRVGLRWHTVMPLGTSLCAVVHVV